MTTISTHRVELESPWHLLAEGELMPAPRLKQDEALRPEVMQAISIRMLGRDIRDPSYVVLGMRVKEPPIDLSYEFFVRSGSQSWRMGPLSFVKGEDTHASVEAYLPSLPENAVVDVVMTPNPEVAREPWKTEEYRMGNRIAYLSVAEIWGGDVVFRALPVERVDLTPFKERAGSLYNKR